MATMRCKCGTVLRDDSPDMNYLVLTRREFDVDAESLALRGRERLGEPVEYLSAAGAERP